MMDYNFTYILSEIYLMTKCGKSGIKAVYNYKNKNYVITRSPQNVTSETTLSGPLNSSVLHATTYRFSNET